MDRVRVGFGIDDADCLSRDDDRHDDFRSNLCETTSVRIVFGYVVDRMQDAGACNPTDIASGQMNLLALPATRACRRNANGVLAIDSVDRNRKISLLRLEALQRVADLDLRACHDP